MITYVPQNNWNTLNRLMIISGFSTPGSRIMDITEKTRCFREAFTGWLCLLTISDFILISSIATSVFAYQLIKLIKNYSPRALKHAVIGLLACSFTCSTSPPLSHRTAFLAFSIFFRLTSQTGLSGSRQNAMKDRTGSTMPQKATMFHSKEAPRT